MALTGAGIAWGWYDGRRWVSFVAPLLVAVLAFAVSQVGVSRLPRDPVRAVRLMPWRILVPAVVAAAAAGLVIIATVELTLPDKTSAGTPTPTHVKEIVGALSTAVTAFLGAAFIDWTSDSDDSRIADWIESTFHAKYTNVFKKGSLGEQLVYSSYVGGGWGTKSRRRRASQIADAFNDPAQRS